MTAVLSKEIQEDYLRRIPLARPGTPQDVAQTVAWLCSEAASYITGQVLHVSGGLYM
jgi:3-oxoacyl-[acyl-carrier protein] reductase